MEVVKMKKALFLGAVFLSLCILAGKVSFAESAEIKGERKHAAHGLIFETLPEEDKNSLLQLKEECREKFRKKIVERKEELAQMEEENPQEFEEVMRQARSKMEEHAEQIRKGHPRGFAKCTKEGQRGAGKLDKRHLQKNIIFETLNKKEQRKILNLREKYREALKTTLQKKRKELELLREKDPDKFKGIIEKAKQKFVARVKQTKKHCSDKFDRLKEIKPECLKERLKWLKDEYPKVYKELIGRSPDTESNDTKCPF